MNDVSNLLDRAAADASPVADDLIAADLARGRRALRQRRVARMAGPVAGAAVVAAVGGGLLVVDRGPVDLPVAGQQAGVELVSFSAHVPGYEVAAIPDGWAVETATRAHLVIAPAGGVPAPDEDHGEFIGKLVVALRSPDATGTPAGVAVDVGGGQGYLDTNGAAPFAQALTYVDSAGNQVVVQVPPSLGWDAEQTTAFAEGVTVTADARPARG
jgi:hypothetical protein